MLIIPAALLLIWTIVFAILGIRYLIKHITSEHFRAAIPLIILVITISLIAFVPSDIIKAKLEYELYSDKRMEIITSIQKNELSDDVIGNVRLPIKYRFFSSDGEVHIYENDADGTVVGFWVFRGIMTSPYTSVIYTSYDTMITCATLGGGEIYDILELGKHWYCVKAY